MTGRNSVLPSLRSSKELGQSNFTNPGIELYGLGADFDILPELRLSTNFNKLLLRRNRGPGDAAQSEAGRLRHRLGPVGGHHLPAVLHAEHRVAPLGRDPGPGPGLPRSLPGRELRGRDPVLGARQLCFYLLRRVHLLRRFHRSGEGGERDDRDTPAGTLRRTRRPGLGGRDVGGVCRGVAKAPGRSPIHRRPMPPPSRPRQRPDRRPKAV